MYSQVVLTTCSLRSVSKSCLSDPTAGIRINDHEYKYSHVFIHTCIHGHCQNVLMYTRELAVKEWMRDCKWQTSQDGCWGRTKPVKVHFQKQRAKSEVSDRDATHDSKLTSEPGPAGRTIRVNWTVRDTGWNSVNLDFIGVYTHIWSSCFFVGTEAWGSKPRMYCDLKLYCTGLRTGRVDSIVLRYYDSVKGRPLTTDH